MGYQPIERFVSKRKKTQVCLIVNVTHPIGQNRLSKLEPHFTPNNQNNRAQTNPARKSINPSYVGIPNAINEFENKPQGEKKKANTKLSQVPLKNY